MTDAWLRFVTRLGWLALGCYVARAVVALILVWTHNASDPLAGVR